MKNKYYSLQVDEEKSEATIDIYGDITSWPWRESDVSSYILSKQIDGLDVDEIHVYINSYGGDVAEGWAIYNALKRHKAKIITHNDGFAASIASVIFMAGDERYMSDVSLLFIHNAWTRTAGNASELRKVADDIEKMSQLSTDAYMKHVTISEEELKEKLDDETWIAPDEAVEWGFATAIEGEIVEVNPSQSVKKGIMQKLIGEEKIFVDHEKLADMVAERIKSSKVPEEPDGEPEPVPRENKSQNLFLSIFK